MRPPVRPLLAGVTVAVLSACGAGPAAEPVPGTGIACVDTTAEGYCDRYVADLARRTPLTPEQRATAEAAERSVALALSGDVLNRCNAKHEPCDQVMAWAQRPATVDHVRALLVAVGAGRPEVRPARPDDPAVPGTVAFGVHVEQVCVYGYQRRNREADRVEVAGPFPRGTCLAP